jgi:hypothetical protein
MAGETFDPPGSPTAGTTVYATWARKANESVVVLGNLDVWDLGGSEIDGHTDTSWARLRGGKIIAFCEEQVRGRTLTLQVFVRVADVSPVGTVQVRLWNVDDASAVVTMAGAVSDTDLTQYDVAITAPAGTTPKRCRLEIQVSSADCPGFAFGQIEITP